MPVTQEPASAAETTQLARHEHICACFVSEVDFGDIKRKRELDYLYLNAISRK